MSPGSLSSIVKTGNVDEVLIVGMNGTNVSTHNKLMPRFDTTKSDSNPSPAGRKKRSCRESKKKVDSPKSKRRRKEEEPTSKTNGCANKKSSREEHEFTWICVECNEAECLENPEAELILCEGKCNRAFHHPCANLSSIPSSEEAWICEDCQTGHHQCAICQQYGADDEDVFRCDKQDCGLFFHESCLSMRNVEIQITETSLPLTVEEEGLDVEPVIMSKPRFTCPAHSCWSCTEDYVPPEDDEAPVKKRSKGRNTGKSSNGVNYFASKRDPRLYVSCTRV